MFYYQINVLTHRPCLVVAGKKKKQTNRNSQLIEFESWLKANVHKMTEQWEIGHHHRSQNAQSTVIITDFIILFCHKSKKEKKSSFTISSSVIRFLCVLPNPQ